MPTTLHLIENWPSLYRRLHTCLLLTSTMPEYLYTGWDCYRGFQIGFQRDTNQFIGKLVKVGLPYTDYDTRIIKNKYIYKCKV